MTTIFDHLAQLSWLAMLQAKLVEIQVQQLQDAVMLLLFEPRISILNLANVLAYLKVNGLYFLKQCELALLSNEGRRLVSLRIIDLLRVNFIGRWVHERLIRLPLPHLHIDSV